MSPKHTPWRVEAHKLGFSSRFYVARGYHSAMEYMRASTNDWRDGLICDFATEQAARAAIAKATGGAA